MEIRRLGSGDAELFRDVRLRALEDAPYAFSSWFAREAVNDCVFWHDRVAESEAAKTGGIFVALDRCRSVGMAGGFFPDEQRVAAVLWGMWVDPERSATWRWPWACGSGSRLGAGRWGTACQARARTRQRTRTRGGVVPEA